ncbi:MAG: deoxyribonuclease IV [Clostridium sp.]|nr:deoxyribonuclease IV [Clostridium sp.]MBO6150973.1 deoxyribonuclease IV [Clostridium sp.]
MLHIGCHLSSTGGYLAMGKEALRIGADTFAFFTRNPRGGNVKPMNTEDAEALRDLLREHDFAPLVAHAPYTYNLCSDKEVNREFAKRSMKEDLERLRYLPGNYYNFHPGSHMKQGLEEGIRMIAEALNELMTEDMETTILLETMAGKGTEVGRTFAELKQIIDAVRFPEHMGVCLDTCHVFDAGYDIQNRLDEVLDTFDREAGLGNLKAIHLNDSKNPFASHRDRHEVIGAGSLGMETFRAVVNHPKLKDLPFILETPQPDNDGYMREIAMVRGLVRKS